MRLPSAMLLFGGCLASAGCMPMSMRPAPIEYAVSLQSVQRPASAETRYGKQVITTVTDTGGKRYRYADSLLAATFYVGEQAVYFEIENRTEYPMQIGWTEAAFVGFDGQSQPVMHTGVKYADCAAPKAPSVIIGKGRLEDRAIPCNGVHLAPGLYGGWVIDAIFPLATTTLDSVNIHVPKARTLTKGKAIRMLLPLKVQDVVNDYTFTFVVDEVSAPAWMLPKLAKPPV